MVEGLLTTISTVDISSWALINEPGYEDRINLFLDIGPEEEDVLEVKLTRDSALGLASELIEAVFESKDAENNS